jgi:predicted ATPase
MFKKVRIQNFRQFKDLTLDNLAQINLITGANNTGKTSVLEAIFMHVTPDNPEIVLEVARLRDIANVVPDGPNAWGWIFHSHADSETIAMDSIDTTGDWAKLRIMTSEGLQLPVSHSRSGARLPGMQEVTIATSGRPLHSLVFEYEDSHGQHGSSRIRLDGGDPRIELESGGVGRHPAFFLASRAARSESDAQVYSRIVQANLEDEILDALRMVDPRLRRLRVLDTGTGPAVFADFGDGNLLPTSVAGQGFSRLLSMVSSIIEVADGFVLVDELENGLHYSVLPDVWRVIVRTAVTHNVQIFATTHSLECVRAATKAAKDVDDRLALFRLSRRDEDIRVTGVEQEGMQAALDFAFELR